MRVTLVEDMGHRLRHPLGCYPPWVEDVDATPTFLADHYPHPHRAFTKSPHLRAMRGYPAAPRARPASRRLSSAPMAADIDVTVLVFASLRDRVGSDAVRLRLPSATPVGAVWDHLPEPARSTPIPPGLRYAVNEEWTPPGAPLRDGDRVALVLPVSGG